MAIPWLPIISAGASLLGSLFGNQTSDKEKVNSNTATTAGTTGQTKMDSSTNQTSTQNQVQNSNQQSSQDTAEEQATKQYGSVQRLDTATLTALTQAVQSALGGATVGKDAATQRLSQISGGNDQFDADAYVKGITGAAKSQLDQDVESGGNQIASRTGARASSNSATALLQSKLNRAAVDQLGGIKQDATARAEEIRRAREESKTGQITNLAASTDNSVQGLLAALLQSTETSQQTGNQIGKSNTVGSTVGTTGTTTTGTINETANQEQKQIGTQTGVEKTQSTGSKDSGSTNWSDFFTKFGQIFSAGF